MAANSARETQETFSSQCLRLWWDFSHLPRRKIKGLFLRCDWPVCRLTINSNLAVTVAVTSLEKCLGLTIGQSSGSGTEVLQEQPEGDQGQLLRKTAEIWLQNVQQSWCFKFGLLVSFSCRKSSQNICKYAEFHSRTSCLGTSVLISASFASVSLQQSYRRSELLIGSLWIH